MKLSEVLALQKKKKEGNGSGSAARPKAQPVSGNKSAVKVVRTRETPNPSALQFVLNSQVLEHGNLSYESGKDCGGDKLGQALFEKRGVKTVYIMDNFITVTKEDDADWNPLKDQVWKTIDQNVTLYKSREGAKLNIDVENFPSLSDREKLDAVEMVLNRSIRSNLAKDGGGVEVKGIDGNVIKILYQGACGSCPTSSTGTLQYIQTQLRQQLHQDLEVQSG
ncbi:nitrogen-fixing protein NifU [Candidatus Nitromaritima sp. SCGC AAA799-A02]|nr:nitrogen-fixing protein NifU [Candidatus Nitromaritima sp. SCGC AAA799-C22]KMP11855.1 nitrogen-fixing protein NifU [Candidatus Nitromaritima sp. SCGC AAA799-A02]